MCEPTHSIIQYDDPNDPSDDNDTPSAQGGYSQSRLTSGLSKWTKKIKNWLHLSMMGRGHSETIGQRSGVTTHHYDTTMYLYESYWWNRVVKQDGIRGAGITFHSPYSEQRKQLQLNCAEEYAKLTSIGDLTQLRRFLEVSLRNTDRPQEYLHRLYASFLNEKGQQQFSKKMRRVFQIKKFDDSGIEKVCHKHSLDSVIKFALGFTRKRELIVPEWADDTKLWSTK